MFIQDRHFNNYNIAVINVCILNYDRSQPVLASSLMQQRMSSSGETIHPPNTLMLDMLLLQLMAKNNQ